MYNLNLAWGCCFWSLSEMPCGRERCWVCNGIRASGLVDSRSVCLCNWFMMLYKMCDVSVKLLMRFLPSLTHIWDVLEEESKISPFYFSHFLSETTSKFHKSLQLFVTASSMALNIKCKDWNIETYLNSLYLHSFFYSVEVELKYVHELMGNGLGAIILPFLQDIDNLWNIHILCLHKIVTMQCGLIFHWIWSNNTRDF